MLRKSFVYCVIVLSLLATSVLRARQITVINQTSHAYTLDTSGRAWSLINPFAAVVFIDKDEKVQVDIPDTEDWSTFYFVRTWESSKESNYIDSFLSVLAEAAAGYHVIGKILTNAAVEPQWHQVLQISLLCALYGKQISTFIGLNRVASVTFKADDGKHVILIKSIEDSFMIYKQDKVSPYVSSVNS